MRYQKHSGGGKDRRFGDKADGGMWTLRCQGCGESFQVEFIPGQNIVEATREESCPRCHNRPASMPAEAAPADWHHIVGFRAPSNSSH